MGGHGLDIIVHGWAWANKAYWKGSLNELWKLCRRKQLPPSPLCKCWTMNTEHPTQALRNTDLKCECTVQEELNREVSFSAWLIVTIDIGGGFVSWLPSGFKQLHHIWFVSKACRLNSRFYKSSTLLLFLYARPPSSCQTSKSVMGQWIWHSGLERDLSKQMRLAKSQL